MAVRGTMSFSPKFQITPALTQILMDIEASRQAVSTLPMTVQLLESLRESARLTATHYSTQIEGNRLTQEQVGEVLHGGTFPNRERDEREVRNYYQALDYVDRLIKDGDVVISENNIKTIHGLVMEGIDKPTSYRDGQNVIKDGSSGNIVYMPPEAKDVPKLMVNMMAWINTQREQGTFPVPIIAAIAHYQFATIHPYYDGNGRTARLLTNIILHKSGYGLKGIYSLEEYYARNLQAYYDALSIGDSHNYYYGRAEADITKWIVYFCEGMADAFAQVRLKASEAAKQAGQEEDQSSLLRELDQRQKQALSLFRESRFVTTRQLADLLKIHPRSTLNLCKKWIEEGFLIQHGTSNKTRKYELATKWIKLLS
ncbi:MAG: Fic family protein [Proteobacteria bacterium]|nr:Fic family protein [Pseudomonadota bacterium]